MYKRTWLFVAIVALSLSLIVAACGPAATTETDSPIVTPEGPPAATPLPDEEQEAVEAARQALAQRLDIAADEIELVRIEAVEWPDTSLGCPEPGMSYAQVITPGYRIILQAGGEAYEYHTGGGNVVLCQDSDRGEGEATSLPPEVAGLIQLARQDLSQRVGVPEEEITVQLVEAVEWRDSSLGCPEPGLEYLQVITPGYRIRLVADGEVYEYHTDDERIVYCEPPIPATPGAGG